MSAMAAARAVFDQEYKPSLAKAAKKQKAVIAGGIGTLALDELWKKHKSEYCKGFEAKMAAAAAKDQARHRRAPDLAAHRGRSVGRRQHRPRRQGRAWRYRGARLCCRPGT